eukprot:EG_transcript_8406
MVPCFPVESSTLTCSGKAVLQLKNVEMATQQEIRGFFFNTPALMHCALYDLSWFLLFTDSTAAREALESIKRRVLRDCKPIPKLLTLRQLPKPALEMLLCLSPDPRNTVVDVTQPVEGSVAIMQIRSRRRTECPPPGF